MRRLILKDSSIALTSLERESLVSYLKLLGTQVRILKSQVDIYTRDACRKELYSDMHAANIFYLKKQFMEIEHKIDTYYKYCNKI